MISSDYIPALRYHHLTVLYDAVLRLTMREDTFKRALIQQAEIEPGEYILDLGCGTATLTLLLKKYQPEATVVGLDADPKALAIAEHKAQKARLGIILSGGLSFALPYPDQVFDHVFSSLLLHNLTREHKIQTLQEVRRVLKTGGGLYIADWGRPHNFLMRRLFGIVQLLDGFETTADHVQGLLPQIIQGVGFQNVVEKKRLMTMFGTISLYTACSQDVAFQ